MSNRTFNEEQISFPGVYKTIFRHTGIDVLNDPRFRSDRKVLEEAAGDDPNRLSCMLKRRISGEPLPYITGEIEFGGSRFHVDKRVYITDPEAIYLINLVRDSLAGQAVSQILEIGTGCGSLSILLKKALPDCTITALDIDEQALDVARENASTHQVDIRFLESDYFMGLPDDYSPDILFSDPPWGTEESIYEDSRPASYYHAMPGLSVWPFGSSTGIHEQLIEEILNRAWHCELFINFGMLDSTSINKALKRAPEYKLVRPAKNVTLAHIFF